MRIYWRCFEFLNLGSPPKEVIYLVRKRSDGDGGSESHQSMGREKWVYVVQEY